ncbi:MAG: Lrp/AsnC family transcriptional regulator [Eubacterium sp.]|nr:Lrp/AsnC family transcriptional regulator [Eubacterium sp.]
MDQVDYRILKILQNNARETASNISKDIHLSVSAVIERIHKLEESGVISKYTIIVDEKKVGSAMTALMEVALEKPVYYDSFAEAIRDMDSVVSCYYQTGGFDLLLKIACDSPDELEQVHRSVMNLEGVKDTQTHVVLKTVKNVYSSIRKPKN